MPDPYRNYKFEVEIQGFARAGFSKVSGLKQTTEVVEYREGGENETPRKLPGQTTFDNVTFSRGVSDDTDFIEWTGTVFNVDNVNGVQGDDNFRRNVIIYLKDKSGSRVQKWTLHRAWPMDMSESDLDATANEVLIEELILAHEGMKRETL